MTSASALPLAIVAAARSLAASNFFWATPNRLLASMMATSCSSWALTVTTTTSWSAATSACFCSTVAFCTARSCSAACCRISFVYCFSCCRAICRRRTGSAIFSGGLMVVIKAWMTSIPCAAQVSCISVEILLEIRSRIAGDELFARMARSFQPRIGPGVGHDDLLDTIFWMASSSVTALFLPSL